MLAIKVLYSPLIRIEESRGKGKRKRRDTVAGSAGVLSHDLLPFEMTRNTGQTIKRVKHEASVTEGSPRVG